MHAYIYRRGHVTEKGLKQTVSCVKALKDVLGDEIGLALDCGPGWTVPAAIQLARALEPMNVMWLEDLLVGDYTPYTLPEAYRLVTRSTSTPIHTGEQVYLRQGFQGLIEKNAVSIVGPRPTNVATDTSFKDRVIWLSLILTFLVDELRRKAGIDLQVEPNLSKPALAPRSRL